MLVFRAKLRSRKHVMTVAQHFRFLAPLGMTGTRGQIIATNPFYLPMSARQVRGDKSASLEFVLFKLTECSDICNSFDARYYT